MHHAVKIDSPEIVKILLESKDIDVNITDSYGKKPIDYSKNDEIIKLLSQYNIIG